MSVQKKQSRLSRNNIQFIDLEQGTSICRLPPSQNLEFFFNNKISNNSLSLIIFMVLFGLLYFFFSNFFFVNSPIDLASEGSTSFLTQPQEDPKNIINSVQTHHPNVNTVARRMPRMDIVYSYVNGSDPKRLKLKLNHLLVERKNQFSTVDFDNVGSLSLARDNNELLYSLRSVNQHFKWFHGKIYIITDQIPNWLNTSHPQIHIIRSEDILPQTHLPTFNSHAIEANLHKIPGLSEYFLYLNDDYLIGADVPQSYYLRREKKGVSKVIASNEEDICMTFYHDERETLRGDSIAKPTAVHYAAMKNVNELLDHRFEPKPRFFLPHAPHLFKRSALEEMAMEFGEKFTETSSSKFRSWSNIHTAYFFANYLVEGGKSCAEFKKMRNKCYFNQDYCIKLLWNLADSKLFFEKIRKVKKPWKFMSINDHLPDSSADMNEIVELLGNYLSWKYPRSSPWEKNEAFV